MVDLKKLAFDKSLNQSSLGEILGLPQPEVSKLVNGRRDIQQEHIDRLIAAFGKEYVDKYIIPDEVHDVFNRPQTRSIEATVISAEIVEEIREEVRAEIAKAESVPLVSSKIANDTNVEDLQEFLKKKGDELEQIKPGDLVGNADTAERIRKTSMMPTFMPGDVVFVQFLDDKTNITDGHTYYFKMATKPTMIRKVKIEGDNLRLIAENPNFGDIITTFDEIVNVATIEGMFRSSFSNQYAEVESVRRKKDEQIDNLIEQNGQALQIIKDLIKK